MREKARASRLRRRHRHRRRGRGRKSGKTSGSSAQQQRRRQRRRQKFALNFIITFCFFLYFSYMCSIIILCYWCAIRICFMVSLDYFILQLYASSINRCQLEIYCTLTHTHARIGVHAHTLATRHDTATGDRHGGVGKQHQRAHAQTHSAGRHTRQQHENNGNAGWLTVFFFSSSACCRMIFEHVEACLCRFLSLHTYNAA